ncbi:MAG: 2-keto-4-pentenoate hydratase [Rubrobacter sp.]
MKWTEMRLANGEVISGRKIGLTSVAMQKMMNVAEPDYGTLWSSRYYAADSSGRAEVFADTFIAPRVEGELAFLIAEPLSGPDVTAEQVIAATEAIAVSVEIVDSRVKDWRITLADTTADNFSYGGYTLGPWDKALKDTDLRTLGTIVFKNDEPAIEAVGAAALGNPANAVAWLAQKLHSFDVGLNPGDVVLRLARRRDSRETGRYLHRRGLRTTAPDGGFRIATFFEYLRRLVSRELPATH